MQWNQEAKFYKFQPIPHISRNGRFFHKIKRFRMYGITYSELDRSNALKKAPRGAGLCNGIIYQSLSPQIKMRKMNQIRRRIVLTWGVYLLRLQP